MPTYNKLVAVAIKNPKASLFAIFHILRRISLIDYHILNGYSLYPDFVTILITKRCNYKCQKCSAKIPQEKHRRSEELTTDELKKFIDDVSLFKPAIYFVGGEPTLRADLWELIRYVKSKRMICAMTTNGSLLTEQNVEELINSKLDFLSISIDGDREYHDRERGVSGAYDKAVNGMKGILRYRASDRPHTKLVCVIDPENPGQCEHVLKLANELGVDEVNFGHLMFYPSEIEEDHRKFTEETGIGSSFIQGKRLKKPIRANVVKLKEFIKRAKKISQVPVSITQGDVDIERYYSNEYPSMNSRCMTPWYSVIIQPNGDVSSCSEFTVGNIKDRPLLKLWNDEKLVEFRRMKKKKERIPVCFRCGEGQKIRFE
jgi:MoaA/NifB/PqqE/SkfB family radical SAM enzyme